MTNSKPHEWTTVKISSLAGLITVGIALYTLTPLLRPFSIAILTLAVGWIIYYWANSGESPRERRAIVIMSLIAALVATGIVAANILSSHSSKESQSWCSPASTQNEAGQLNAPVAVEASTNTQSDVRLDKALVSEQYGRGGGCLFIDIVVVNRGKDTVLIDGARIRIERMWFLDSTCSGGRGGGSGGVEISRNYNAVLDLDFVPSSAYVDELTQEVKGDSVDRFSITARLAYPHNVKHSVAIVEAAVDIFYNSETQGVSSKQFGFASNLIYRPEEFRMSAGAMLGQTLQAQREKNYTENKAAAIEVRNKAIVLTPRVKAYVDELTTAPGKTCSIY